MNYKWFVGIDIAKKTLDVVLYKKELQKKSPYCQIQNNNDGFNDLNDRVIKLIDQLPPRRRQVYMMSREEGLTYVEISKKLGISINTVENHISASLKFMRQHFDDTLAAVLFFLLFM